ncbi:DUF7336 domain-containing protein [Microtetraspora fusca]|uniref:DUF7336 domain-containing protein n=1 Tax=Microtetraspora fusca TaxID=1997 RepID=UPI0009FDDF8F|nr:hypothetical protein [Microtetraspora fusca]
MKVYILYHVHHVAEDENGNVRHFEEDGSFSAFEEEGDDIKLLGVYSTEERAERRMSTARGLPGFREEPNCFSIAEYELDEDQWKSGFVTV